MPSVDPLGGWVMKKGGKQRNFRIVVLEEQTLVYLEDRLLILVARLSCNY